MAYVLEIDNGDTEERQEFKTYSEARDAWRVADARVARKEIFSATVRDPEGRRRLHVEQEA